MVEKVSIDDRGRVTIPKGIREKHNFIPGVEFEVIDENDKIILKRLVPKQKKIKAPVGDYRDWQQVSDWAEDVAGKL